jgi:plastocyanin
MRRAIALVMVMGLTAACGGGGGSTASGSPSASGGCVDESSGAVFNLTQQNTAYHPKCVIARSDQSIHIENKDGITHNFSITGTSISVDIQPGKVFNGQSAHLAAGTYQFFCRFHRSLGMTGTIVVK